MFNNYIYVHEFALLINGKSWTLANRLLLFETVNIWGLLNCLIIVTNIVYVKSLNTFHSVSIIWFWINVWWWKVSILLLTNELVFNWRYTFIGLLYVSAPTPWHQTCTGTIERQSSLRPSTIGGGKPTECSTSWRSQGTTQVRDWYCSFECHKTGVI